MVVFALHTDDYYTGPIELIDGLLDVTKKTVLAQIEWTDKFQVLVTLFCMHSSHIALQYLPVRDCL